MISRTSIGGILLFCGLLMTISIPASAEERVLGSWIAKGKYVPIGEEKFSFHGEANGVLHHNDGKGKLDAGKLQCALSVYVDAKAKRENGSGSCTIILTEYDRIYAEFKCAGPLLECKGKFEHVGGTGKYRGISGETDLRWKVNVIKSQPKAEGADSVDQTVTGYFVLPNLTYTLH